MVLCADDDVQTPGNPGVAKAREAAAAVGGVVAVPEFGGDRPETATDFNDLLILHGPQAVRRAISAAAGESFSTGPSGPSGPTPHLEQGSTLDHSKIPLGQTGPVVRRRSNSRLSPAIVLPRKASLKCRRTRRSPKIG